MTIEEQVFCFILIIISFFVAVESWSYRAERKKNAKRDEPDA